MDEITREGQILREGEILTTADIARTGAAPIERRDFERDRETLVSPPAAGRAAPGAPTGAATATAPAQEEANAPLFSQQESDQLHARWTEIQVGFVDEPRHSVEAADKLVAETMQRLGEVFSRGREGLEKQWARGESTSTEDSLRVALRHYRSFFWQRLLAV